MLISSSTDFFCGDEPRIPFIIFFMSRGNDGSKQGEGDQGENLTGFSRVVARGCFPRDITAAVYSQPRKVSVQGTSRGRPGVAKKRRPCS